MSQKVSKLDIASLLALLQDQQRPTLEIPEQSEPSTLTQIAAPAEPPPRPKRCCMEGCKKKLTLTDFPCKCGKIHCSQHRAAEVHACTYDFKAIGKEQLTKAMPTVTAKKVDVI